MRSIFLILYCAGPALLSAALLLLWPAVAAAQEAYPADPSEQRLFDRPTWKRAIEGLDYPRGTATVRDKTSERKGRGEERGGSARNRWQTGKGSWWGAFLFKALIILGSALILFVLLRGLLGLEWAPRNRRLGPSGDLALDLEKIEENLEAHDLEAYIQQALTAGRLDVAVRLYYLQALKELAARRLIRWKRERTNREYLLELRPTALYGPFAELTQGFERVWYGQYPVSEAAFRGMERKFKGFLEELRIYATIPV